jgi:hypothetical protein
MGIVACMGHDDCGLYALGWRLCTKIIRKPSWFLDQQSYCHVRSEVLSSHVQIFVTCIAMEMHNSFEKQDIIHRDARCSGLSLDTCRVWEILC